MTTDVQAPLLPSVDSNRALEATVHDVDNPKTPPVRTVSRTPHSGRQRPTAVPAESPRPPAGGADGGIGDVLAIDVSRRRLAAAIVDDQGHVIVRDRVPNPTRDPWSALRQLIVRVLAANTSKRPPTRCGVTAPGPFDHETGAMMPLGMPAWVEFPLRDEISHVSGLPTTLDTAGRGMAEAEMWIGGYAPSREPDAGRVGAALNFATLVISDDVDGGVVSDGRLLVGRTGNLGQFGHMVVEPDGEICVCGSPGCLTAYASAPGIAVTTSRDLRRTPPSIIERTGIMVGRACASIAALTDASELVIGGAVPETFGRPFFEALDLELDRRLGADHLADFRVRPASEHVGPLVAAAAVGRRPEPD